MYLLCNSACGYISMCKICICVRLKVLCQHWSLFPDRNVTSCNRGAGRVREGKGIQKGSHWWSTLKGDMVTVTRANSGSDIYMHCLSFIQGTKSAHVFSPFHSQLEDTIQHWDRLEPRTHTAQNARSWTSGSCWEPLGHFLLGTSWSISDHN